LLVHIISMVEHAARRGAAKRAFGSTLGQLVGNVNATVAA
jgi:hypothetical protein